MKRSNPLLTPLGLSLTLVLFTGLGLSLFFRGGSAFSPGPLTAMARQGSSLSGFAAHADFENECARCHQPLTTIQAVLCLDCHQEVAAQIEHTSGLHSRVEGVMRCFACHADHRGRDFDPGQAALAKYDHTLARFSLIRHQVDYDLAPLDCADCHDFSTSGDSASEARCEGCHSVQDAAFMQQHLQDYGSGCLDCHDGIDSLAQFDHTQTQFALLGKHTGLSCAACHIQGRFENTASACAACHAEPDVHRGFFEQDCFDCHTAEAWLPAVIDGQAFDHTTHTSFSLALHGVDYAGQTMTCLDCHAAGSTQSSTGQCAACHSEADLTFMTAHRAEFGDGCLDCHDGVDRMHAFDHNQVFVLDGRHLEIDCQACHVQRVFAGTPVDCAGCHQEPEIHAGFFGLHCQNCHTTTAWIPALLREHTFPLDHGEEGVIDCQVCHPNGYTEYTCYNCHEHQMSNIQVEHREEGISAEELSNCAKCHPTGREEEGDND